jgi:hypothetical protein
MIRSHKRCAGDPAIVVLFLGKQYCVVTFCRPIRQLRCQSKAVERKDSVGRDLPILVNRREFSRTSEG